MATCTATAVDPRQNRLLAALPDAVWARLEPMLEPGDMPLGEVLFEAHSNLAHVYFPTTSIVSLLHMLANGASEEIAVVGHEGIVGVALFMSGVSTTNRAVVHSAGQGLRLNAFRLMTELSRVGPTLQLYLRHMQALIAQISQTAVCNRHHSLDQQLCRCLLLSPRCPCRCGRPHRI